MIQVYYWQAADRIVAVHYGRIIHILCEEFDHPQYGFRGMAYTIEYSRSKVAKMKTLVYLGEL